MSKKLTKLILITIFILAVGLRFIYFPDNVYFGYDQARDAYISLGILNGDIKIKGPSASFDSNIFHGALSYYVFTPFYFISGGDPTLASVFLRFYNAAGIFLVFLITKTIFNKRTAVFAALIFAFSFEQTQYALFLSHPSLAVITVLLFYYGLTRLFFKQDPKGLILAALGLGLSIQFHFSLSLLSLILIVSCIVFLIPWSELFSRKINYQTIIKIIPLKDIILAAICFFAAIITFIISEYKYGDFHTILTTQGKSLVNPGNAINGLLYHLQVLIRDNLFALVDNPLPAILITILLFGASTFFMKHKKPLAFLSIWFIGGLIPYLMNYSKIYYYGIGGSISLLILTAFAINWIFQKSRIPALVLLVIILSSNLFLILERNQTKFNENIIVQEGLVLPKEKQLIDYIYQKSAGEPFSINAVMIPYNVKTTWDYLFNWYGSQKYGYLPVWGGDAAPGYEGKLKVNNVRSSLPEKRFLIIEPTKNIPSYMISGQMKEEDYFSTIIEEKHFGNITVQFRKAI